MLWIMIESLIHKELVVYTVLFSLNLWVNNLLPSMFLFFVISDVLVEYHITNYIPCFVKNTFTSLFNVSDAVVSIFFLSCISGFPSNARMIRKMYDNGYISLDEVNHALIFTHFSNPLFILSTVAVLFLHHEEYGIIILISHYLGNIILGIIARRYSVCSSFDYTEKSFKSQKFNIILIRAIKKAIDSLLFIFGTLTFFLIIASFLISFLNISMYSGAILKGILEITMGLKQLSMLDISDVYKVVISSMFLSFGGFSVHIQVLSQFVDVDVSYQKFFVARVCHAIVSGFVCFLLFYIFL